MLTRFAQDANISTAWGRLFFVYGPHELERRLVPSVVLALLQAKPALCSHARQIRDYLYVEDAAEAMVALFTSDVEGAVNIASGIPIRLSEIIWRIAAKVGAPELVQLGALETPPNEAPLVVADVRRLTEDVGWRPRYALDEGLDRTIRWWQQLLRDTAL
jgi:nucleoside-diphosphate-sugar epimerase